METEGRLSETQVVEHMKKLDFLQKFFENVPEGDMVIADFPCSMQRDVVVQGRLYLTFRGFFFHSKVFGFVNVASCMWENVTNITKEKAAYFLPISIQLTSDNDKWFFTFFQYRDRIYNILIKIWHNATLFEYRESAESLSSFVTRSLKTDVDQTLLSCPCPSSQDVLKVGVDSGSGSGSGSVDVDVSLPSNGEVMPPKSVCTGGDASGASGINVSECQVEDGFSEVNCVVTCTHPQNKLIEDMTLNGSPNDIRELMFDKGSPAIERLIKVLGLRNYQTFCDETSDPTDEVNRVSYSMPIGFFVPSVCTTTVQVAQPPGKWWRRLRHCSMTCTSSSTGSSYSDYFQVVVTYCFSCVSEGVVRVRIYVRVEFLKEIAVIMKSIIVSRSLVKTEEFVKTLMKFVVPCIEEKTSGESRELQTSDTFVNTFPPSSVPAPSLVTTPDKKDSSMRVVVDWTVAPDESDSHNICNDANIGDSVRTVFSRLRSFSPNVIFFVTSFKLKFVFKILFTLFIMQSMVYQIKALTSIVEVLRKQTDLLERLLVCIEGRGLASVGNVDSIGGTCSRSGLM